MSKTLIVGSNNINTSTFFKKFDLAESVLVTSVDQDYDVGHTAPQEFATIALFQEAMANADLIYWGHPLIAEFINKQEYYNILYLLRQQHMEYNNVVNYETITCDPYKWAHKLPTLTANDSVFIGCSYTAGDGLPDANTHYATLVAREFGTNCVNLGKSGGSNSRSFDIFTQLDFVPDTVVVWQVTFLERLQYCYSTSGELIDLRFLDFKMPLVKEMSEVFNRKFLLNELATKIRAAVTIAREKKLRFAFWFADSITMEEYMYFYNYPELVSPIELEHFLVDKGTDNAHPGPGSNKILADVIIKHINRLYK